MNKPSKKKSRREHYICEGRMMCLTHATTRPKQCPECRAKIHHIGTPEGAALKVKRKGRKHQFSGGFLAKAPKPRKLNRNIGESADAVAWGGLK
jgi:hypothetical protein